MRHSRLMTLSLLLSQQNCSDWANFNACRPLRAHLNIHRRAMATNSTLETTSHSLLGHGLTVSNTMLDYLKAHANARNLREPLSPETIAFLKIYRHGAIVLSLLLVFSNARASAAKSAAQSDEEANIGLQRIYACRR
ncbi:hypothetical protein BTJ68_03292 [Hortaea werneckii EXF-2000]|uniref:Uncharacterized protein n=1 Tax=Hortaea werneckii EXF-2000 TaxID=1157616 RepID=A0A1Z5TL11_HORWE|nr:hypothetical protein BTJ68_03292 [Hortaea werneckii EXF-2000]